MFYKRRIFYWLAKWLSGLKKPIPLEIYQIKERILLSLREQWKPWHTLVKYRKSRDIASHHTTLFYLLQWNQGRPNCDGGIKVIGAIRSYLPAVSRIVYVQYILIGGLCSNQWETLGKFRVFILLQFCSLPSGH